MTKYNKYKATNNKREPQQNDNRKTKANRKKTKQKYINEKRK